MVFVPIVTMALALLVDGKKSAPKPRECTALIYDGVVCRPISDREVEVTAFSGVVTDCFPTL